MSIKSWPFLFSTTRLWLKVKSPNSDAWACFTTGIQLLFHFFFKNTFLLVKMKLILFYGTVNRGQEFSWRGPRTRGVDTGSPPVQAGEPPSHSERWALNRLHCLGAGPICGHMAFLFLFLPSRKDIFFHWFSEEWKERGGGRERTRERSDPLVCRLMF